MFITGLFVTEFAQGLYKDEVKHRLLNVAGLFDYTLSSAVKSGRAVDYNSIARACAAGLGQFADEGGKEIESRITIIDDHGNVLGESQTDSEKMENHLNRKEVQQALQGKTGEDVRFSATLKMDFLYIAVPSSNSEAIIRVSVPLVQLQKINLRIWLYCVLGIIAGLLFTVFLAVRFTSSISRPVGELTYASRKIAEGNYSKRVNIHSDDEFGQLADTFNEMADELEKTVSDLKDKNMKFDAVLNSMTNSLVAVDSDMRIILINSIAARFFGIADNVIGKKLLEVIRNHRINELVRQAITDNSASVTELNMHIMEEGIYRVYTSPIKSAGNSDANSGAIITIHDITNIKKLEQIRTEFVSNVTHELKTPLTSIKGFVETLRSGSVDDPEIRAKFLDIIDIEAERLTMLINDILQLSEIENNRSDTNISICNLSEIISEVISMLQAQADKKNIKITEEAAPKIRIKANRDRIKQMFINLIDNAIKYNIDNGSVRVKAFKFGGKLVISVADTGIGIAGKHLPRIFERFYRVDKGRSRSMGGTGLGLSIVKHIVNLYDGDIQVESEPGKGTEFKIQIPSTI